MAETSGFFNALESGGSYDRVYDAADFANYFSKFVGDGVFANPTNNLQVIASSGLVVTIKAGAAFIEGYWYELTEDTTITLSPNATSYAITDVICCTLDKSNRQITLTTREAVSSILPVNDGSTHELVLASITIGVGVSTITNSVITDRRPDNIYCGYVAAVIDQLETTDLFLQFETAFSEWFETIKGKLSEDIAGSLQNQITTLGETIDGLPQIRYGTAAPDDTVGNDGDVYIQIVE